MAACGVTCGSAGTNSAPAAFVQVVWFGKIHNIDSTGRIAINGHHPFGIDLNLAALNADHPTLPHDRETIDRHQGSVGGQTEVPLTGIGLAIGSINHKKTVPINGQIKGIAGLGHRT